jgi:hypothetical protein
MIPYPTGRKFIIKGDTVAKIEFVNPANETYPAFTETIEVRVWALGGTSDQPFYIGRGANARASGTHWLEITYSVEGVQIFYTRTFLQCDGLSEDIPTLQKQLDKIAAKGKGKFSLGDYLPETMINLTVKKDWCTLVISADTGTVFGRTSPGMRSVDISLPYLDAADGVRFMRELLGDMDAAQQGKHPDPASFPPGSSLWPLPAQLNRRGYDEIAAKYLDNHFDLPLLADAFDRWLEQFPSGGHVLDAGCGHGNPVIARLLERGFQVTGSDISPKMLE